MTTKVRAGGIADSTVAHSMLKHDIVDSDVLANNITIPSANTFIVPGSVLQVKQGTIGEQTLSADAILETMQFTPKQQGSKIFFHLFIPNCTGASGQRAVFQVYGGVGSTYDHADNAKLGQVRIALTGTGADETHTVVITDFGSLTTLNTNTNSHRLFVRFGHSTNTVVARHSDGSAATQGKLIMMEIAQ